MPRKKLTSVYDTDQYVGTATIAELLNTDRSTVYRWCKQGLIPYIKIGKCYKIPLSVIERRLTQ